MGSQEFPRWKKKTSVFLIGQAVSLFGTALVDFALIWHITLLTKSGLMMTFATAAAFLPRLLISLFAGVWADRHNRKLLIIWSDAGIAIATLTLALVFSMGYTDLWLIFLLMGLRSIGSGIQSPAVGAILPQIVPPDKLLRVNGINSSLQSSIMLLSPMAGGALLSFGPLQQLLYIDVLTAIVGIALLLGIAIAPHAKSSPSEKLNYYSDIKEGLVYMKENVLVREMLIMYLFYFFLITPAAFLSPVAVARSFGDEVWRLTVNEIAFSGGMMLGGALIAWWGGLRNSINTIALSCFVIGITHATLAIPNFYIFMGSIAVMGIFASFFSATEMALFQQKVAPDKQGRVFSMVQLIVTAVMPLGMFLFGPLGDLFRIEWQFLACGLLLIVLSVHIFFNKRLKAEATLSSTG